MYDIIKKYSLNNIAKGLLFLFVLLLAGADLYSQDWINKNGGKYTVTGADPVIRMRGVTPKTGYPNQDGVFLGGMGKDEAHRIGGLVDWCLAYNGRTGGAGTGIMGNVDRYTTMTVTANGSGGFDTVWSNPVTGMKQPSYKSIDTSMYPNQITQYKGYPLTNASILQDEFLQHTTDGIFYTNVLLSGTQKLVYNSNVSGTYGFAWGVGDDNYEFQANISRPDNVAYKDATTFTYDGDATADQVVVPSVNNRFYNSATKTTIDPCWGSPYYNLVVKNGGSNGTAIKTLDGNKTALRTGWVDNNFKVEKNTVLKVATGGDVLMMKNARTTVDRQGEIENTAKLSLVGRLNVVSGKMYVREGGEIAEHPDGTTGPNDNAPSQFSDTLARSATIRMSGGTELHVEGEVTNNTKDKTAAPRSLPLTYSYFELGDGTATKPPAKVIYYGKGTVLPMNRPTGGGTTSGNGLYYGNGYGILEFAPGSERHLIDHVYIAGPYENALTYNSEKNTVTGDNNRIIFSNTLANATYNNGIGEVVGWVQHGDVSATTYRPQIGKEYTYNNNQTKLKFGKIGTAGDYLNSFALNVLPNTKPYKAKYSSALADKIADRQITIDYALTMGSGNTYLSGKDTNIRISSLQLGFKPEELNETEYPRYRMVEGYLENSVYADKRPQNVSNTDASRALVRPDWTTMTSANTVYPITFTTSNNGISLRNATDTTLAPGETYQVYHKSQLILDATPTKLISIRNGRWSDPESWDAGTTPTAADSVEIRHIIYTGLYNGNALFGGRAWKSAEDTLNTGVTFSKGNVLAINVLIDTVKGTWKNSALVIGNNVRQGDAAMNFSKVLAFGQGCKNGISIMTPPVLTGVMPSNFTLADAEDKGQNDDYKLNGLYIMGFTAVPDMKGPFIQVPNLANYGNIRNNAIFEVGEIK